MADNRIVQVLTSMSDDQLDGLIRMVLMQQNPLADPMYTGYNKNMASSTFVKSAQSNVEKQMGLFRDRQEKLGFLAQNTDTLAKYDQRFKGAVGPTMTQPIRQVYDEQQAAVQAEKQARQNWERQNQERTALGLESTPFGENQLRGRSVAEARGLGDLAPSASSAAVTKPKSALAGLSGLDPQTALQRAYAMQQDLMANGQYLTQDAEGNWTLTPDAMNLEAFIENLTSQSKAFGWYGGGGGGGGGGGAADHFAENMAWEKEKWAQQMEMQKAEERRAIMQAKAQIAMQAAGLMGDQYGNALRTQAQLAPYSLLPNQKYYMGYEPGGVAQSLFSMAGLPFAPRQAVGIPVDTMQGVNAMQGVVGQLQGLINGLG
jgi:hypothetical protein